MRPLSSAVAAVAGSLIFLTGCGSGNPATGGPSTSVAEGIQCPSAVTASAAFDEGDLLALMAATQRLSDENPKDAQLKGFKRAVAGVIFAVAGPGDLVNTEEEKRELQEKSDLAAEWQDWLDTYMSPPTLGIDRDHATEVDAACGSSLTEVFDFLVSFGDRPELAYEVFPASVESVENLSGLQWAQAYKDAGGKFD